MSMLVGAAASGALSYLQSLLQQHTTKDPKKAEASDPLSMLMQAISDNGAATAQAGVDTPSAKPAGSANSQPFSCETMSALLSAQGQQSTDGPSARLFAKLDTDGNGKVSKTEFGDAVSKAGADASLGEAVFGKIDGDSDGSIRQGELTKADRGGLHRATAQASTNADDSTTMTLTYADGNKAEMTTWATASAGAVNKSPANLLEQLVKLQAQVMNHATSTMSAIA